MNKYSFAFRNNLNPEDIVTEIKLSHNIHNGLFIIVEADSDRKVFTNFFNESCRYYPADGKENALKILSNSEKMKFNRVIGIVDLDFDEPEDFSHKSNCFITDYYDLEMMIVESPAFEKLLIQFLSYENVGNSIKDKSDEIRAIIYSTASFIGLMRFISRIQSLNLYFEDLPMRKFIDETSLEVNVDRMINILLQRSSLSLTQKQELSNEFQRQFDEIDDSRRYCCGHDVMEIIAHSLKKRFGTKKSTKRKDGKDRKTMEATAINVEVLLRTAYEFKHFKLSNLYKSLLEWEKKTKYCLFKES